MPEGKMPGHLPRPFTCMTIAKDCRNMNNETGELEIDLLRMAQALWKKAVGIVIAGVLAAAAALGYTAFFVTPLYKAEALMYVNSNNISVGSTKVSISQAELSAAQTLVDTYIVILNTRATLSEVIAQTKVNYSYEQLKKMISAQSVNSTEVFSITVTSPDPKEAEVLANAIAQILPQKIASIVEGSSARIVDYAVEPTEKASPSLRGNALLGFVLGVILACGVVIIREMLDDVIHDSDYLIQTYDIPVLAVIPDLLSSQSANAYDVSAGQQSKKRGKFL